MGNDNDGSKGTAQLALLLSVASLASSWYIFEQQKELAGASLSATGEVLVWNDQTEGWDTPTDLFEADLERGNVYVHLKVVNKGQLQGRLDAVVLNDVTADGQLRLVCEQGSALVDCSTPVLVDPQTSVTVWADLASQTPVLRCRTTGAEPELAVSVWDGRQEAIKVATATKYSAAAPCDEDGVQPTASG